MALIARVTDFLRFFSRVEELEDLPVYIMSDLGPVPIGRESFKTGVVSIVGPSKTSNGISIPKCILIKSPPPMTLVQYTDEHVKYY
jgi:hypothetical protein